MFCLHECIPGRLTLRSRGSNADDACGFIKAVNGLGLEEYSKNSLFRSVLDIVGDLKRKLSDGQDIPSFALKNRNFKSCHGRSCPRD